MAKREPGFWSQQVRFRGGRRGPRWLSILWGAFVAGAIVLVFHISLLAIMIGLVFILVSPFLFFLISSNSHGPPPRNAR